MMNFNIWFLTNTNDVKVQNMFYGIIHLLEEDFFKVSDLGEKTKILDKKAVDPGARRAIHRRLVKKFSGRSTVGR